MSSTKTAAGRMAMTPADILAYQSDLVRKGQVEHLGRMQMIAIGPHEGCPPHTEDPVMRKWGRLMHLRERMLPIGFSLDHSQLLVTAPLVSREGRVELPDVPDPGWVPGQWTEDERTGKITRPFDKDKAAMVPQRLEDRAEGLFGNFYVFSPVEYLTFQPELGQQMQPTVWRIQCHTNPADGTKAALLVERRTGETHFFGGLYELQGAAGE